MYNVLIKPVQIVKRSVINCGGSSENSQSSKSLVYTYILVMYKHTCNSLKACHRRSLPHKEVNLEFHLNLKTLQLLYFLFVILWKSPWSGGFLTTLPCQNLLYKNFARFVQQTYVSFYLRV